MKDLCPLYTIFCCSISCEIQQIKDQNTFFFPLKRSFCSTGFCSSGQLDFKGSFRKGFTLKSKCPEEQNPGKTWPGWGKNPKRNLHFFLNSIIWRSKFNYHVNIEWTKVIFNVVPLQRSSFSQSTFSVTRVELCSLTLLVRSPHPLCLKST